ncbi:4a-hydroxytetrahydrobiopterin dehydratase [Oxynema sp. CENA135]|uniref:4a-hydroxytetrahydrobiopterin dehydratase n=1 Tax=Oxynema sp. CENA135 TaxID=984206 RepID=UPI00190DCDDD|nr:4a-hydroxytetrahydrobiopterin dehydratase [Oxynema sp. CENA135]MBK4730084.1 4a-hydroxytetrahydrobiopterin dehydratase [Oxynema sp. CENA135]
MAELLNSEQIQSALSELSGWTVEGKTLQCERTFKDFIEAIAFVNRLVDPAERARHHPDLAISYNRVKITLTTHDAGGLTANDFEMAKVISQIS